MEFRDCGSGMGGWGFTVQGVQAAARGTLAKCWAALSDPSQPDARPYLLILGRYSHFTANNTLATELHTSGPMAASSMPTPLELAALSCKPPLDALPVL